MKFVRVRLPDGRICYALQQQGKLLEIEGDLFGEHRMGRPVEGAKPLPPVQPPNIIAIGLNYRQHAVESRMQLPDEPLIFLKATTSVIGPGEPIVLPASAPEQVDYEGELAVVIGRQARKIHPQDARDYILGYTCANDVTARDCQHRRDKQWARAKSFDSFCPLGPCIVADEKLDPSALRIRTYLNGKLMQDASTADMIFPVAELVSYLSQQFTLLAGTVICTGTPPGVGFARRPAVFLKPGDIVSIEIEGIGTLSNPVIAETNGGG